MLFQNTLSENINGALEMSHRDRKIRNVETHINHNILLMEGIELYYLLYSMLGVPIEKNENGTYSYQSNNYYF